MTTTGRREKKNFTEPLNVFTFQLSPRDALKNPYNYRNRFSMSHQSMEISEFGWLSIISKVLLQEEPMTMSHLYIATSSQPAEGSLSNCYDVYVSV